jgi:hypothetical protein
MVNFFVFQFVCAFGMPPIFLMLTMVLATEKSLAKKTRKSSHSLPAESLSLVRNSDSRSDGPDQGPML